MYKTIYVLSCDLEDFLSDVCFVHPTLQLLFLLIPIFSSQYIYQQSSSFMMWHHHHL